LVQHIGGRVFALHAHQGIPVVLRSNTHTASKTLKCGLATNTHAKLELKQK